MKSKEPDTAKVRPDWKALAAWKSKCRGRSVKELLEASLKDRLPELTGLRYARMSASAFSFFRGSACVMAYDLSLGANSGVLVQMCGDAHVQNLGAYAGDDGRLIFDINDFDETACGPFDWEIKRMATSILLAGDEAELKRTSVEDAVEAFLSSYCALIRLLLPMPVLEVARFQVRRLRGVASISKILARAERATPLLSLEALTTHSPTGRVFRSDPPLLKRIDGPERNAVLDSLKGYRESLLPERRHFFARFRPIDVAFKVVGTGSIGLRNYVLYLEGNGAGDPLFLQIKQQPGSCWAPYLRTFAGPSRRGLNQGRRVAEGQRAMQLQSDPLLGWTRVGRYDFLVRQLYDHKASITVDHLKEVDLLQYARVCGEILARGHARSGDVREVAAFVGKGGALQQGDAALCQSLRDAG